MRFRSALLPSLFVAVVLFARPLPADEKLKDIACRSVHLSYPGRDATAFYNEIAIDRSAPGTYFCACGWDKGYFGLQELANGKKLVIFSVWDSAQNDPKAIAVEKRVGLLHKHEKVRIGRFGGEGTGGQSFFDYDWKVGRTYRLMVRCRVDGERTEYEGWFFVPEDKAWMHLVTFSTITGGSKMSGFYSFVEDFKRDRVSATKSRRAHYGNGWVQGKDEVWKPTTEAKFTADSNPSMAIDAGVDAGRFFLTTGGDTKNAGTELRGSMKLEAVERTAPADLPDRSVKPKK